MSKKKVVKKNPHPENQAPPSIEPKSYLGAPLDQVLARREAMLAKFRKGL